MSTFDAYLQLDGTPGESLDDKHKDWIELLDFSHGMEQPTSSTRSSAGGGTTGRTKHGDFIISKYIDKASPKLYSAVSSGKASSKAKIEVCRSGGSQVKFLEINLEEVVISRVDIQSTNGSANGATGSADNAHAGFPIEQIALNYGKIEWIYTQQKRKDGSGGGNVSAKHDLTAGKAG
jgi:type VI secretion system secreted protein Hcp